MAELILSGVVARCMEPNELGDVVQAAATAPRAFSRFFDAGQFDAARARTTQTGALDEAAACALTDCLAQCGVAFGSLVLEAHEVDDFPARFLELAALALDDERSAQRLLDGGVLDRVGAGRHFFGSMPVRVVARQFSKQTRDVARQVLRGGWDEDLLNLLESAALRAKTNPEDLLVLYPVWRERVAGADEPPVAEVPSVVEQNPTSTSPGVDVLSWLELARARGATDLSVVVGQPLALHGASGRVEVGAPLTAPEVDEVVSLLLDAHHRERFEAGGALVAGFSVEGQGRFRLTALSERGARSVAIRTHFVPPEPAALGLPGELHAALAGLRRGLVVVASPSGQGRTTLQTALVGEHARDGREVVTLEEPVAWPALRGPVRQLELHTDVERQAFEAIARTVPAAVVAVDLVDDDEAATLALELASEGKLVFVTQRALSSAAALHKLAALDAPRARRRLAEALAAVVTLRLIPAGAAFVHAAELLLPTEALRRHLRGNETPAPPVLLDPEGLSLDDRLLAAVRRGALSEPLARQWMVDARRLSEG